MSHGTNTTRLGAPDGAGGVTTLTGSPNTDAATAAARIKHAMNGAGVQSVNVVPAALPFLRVPEPSTPQQPELYRQLQYAKGTVAGGVMPDLAYLQRYNLVDNQRRLLYAMESLHCPCCTTRDTSQGLSARIGAICNDVYFYYHGKGHWKQQHGESRRARGLWIMARGGIVDVQCEYGHFLVLDQQTQLHQWRPRKAA